MKYSHKRIITTARPFAVLIGAQSVRATDVEQAPQVNMIIPYGERRNLTYVGMIIQRRDKMFLATDTS